MHKLLRRQLERTLGHEQMPTDEASWHAFLDRVSEAYERSDADRTLVERAMDLASQELIARNANLTNLNERFRQAVRAVDAAIYDWSLEGTTIEWTEGVREVFGHKLDHLTTSFDWWLERVHPDDRPGLEKALRDIISNRTDFILEYRFQRGDSSYAHVWDRGVFARRPDGSSHVIGSIADISSRVVVERLARDQARELSVREGRLRALIGNLSEVIFVVDPTGRLTFVSDSVTRVLGYQPEEVIGSIGPDLAHPDDFLSVFGVPAGAAPPPIARAELRLRHKDGTWRLAEVSGSSARHVPGIAGDVWVVRDITEERALEREAEAHREATSRASRLSALGTLVAGVAHEINNPLTYIGGNIELAMLAAEDLKGRAQRNGEDTSDHDDIIRAMQTALSGASRIATITRALRTVTRGSGSGARERVDLGAVATNVLSLMEVNLPNSIIAEADVEPDLVVYADSTALHQVVLNLVKNGAEAIAHGSGAGRLRIRARRGEGNAIVTVEDDGPGIPAHVREHLFTPFFTTKSTGTGLGLSIVHGIVKDHGGDIHVESEPGSTRFVVRLPLATS